MVVESTEYTGLPNFLLESLPPNKGRTAYTGVVNVFVDLIVSVLVYIGQR